LPIRIALVESLYERVVDGKLAYPRETHLTLVVTAKRPRCNDPPEYVALALP